MNAIKEGSFSIGSRRNGDLLRQSIRPTSEKPAGSNAGGRAEQRQLTVMFADLVGSTELSERLDLEQFYDVVDAYLECCDTIVREHLGFIAQHQGDCILAYFGFPSAAEDDAERAAAAGLAIVKAVARLKLLQDHSLETRVGIATGVVLVSELRRERAHGPRSVLGETPNRAARLQAAATPGTVVVDATTRRLLAQSFVCDDLGTRQLKGFSEPVRLWQVGSARRSAARFEDRQRGDLTPFVGRAEEVGLFLRRWRRAKRGDGQVVLVTGEPGIGKSRLTRVLCERIARERHTRLVYQCSLNRTAAPLHPVIAQLEFAAGFAALDTPEEKLDKVERLVERFADDIPATARIIARLLSIPAESRYGPVDLAPGQIKDATLEHLLRMVMQLAAREPLLVMFEDLHWIDPTTEEFLDLLIDNIGKLRVLLVCTARPEYTALWAVRSRVTTLNLTRLDVPHSAALIEQVSGGQRLPPEVVEKIVEKTDGVPLFIEELTKSLLESGSLRLERDGYAFDGRLDTLSLPSTLQGSLLTRLDRLPGASSVAPVGAAIGRTFSYELLRAVTELDGAVLQPALDRLVEAQLLFRWGLGQQAFYTFKHALVQDAAYGTLLKSQRRALHASIASILRERFPDIVANQPDVLAQHYALAGLASEAIEFWRHAATIAVQSSANAEASAHIRAALEQNQQIEKAEERVTNEIALRQMLCVPLEAQSWGSKDIEENLRRLHHLVKGTGDRKKLFSVLHGLCGVHIIGGRMSSARKIARKMSEVATQGDEAAFFILSEHALGMSYFFSGDLVSATAHFEAVTAHHEHSMREELKLYYVADPHLVAHCMSGWALLLLGKERDAARHIKTASRLAEAESHVFSRIYAFGIMSSFYQTKGDPRAALKFATQAMELSRENKSRYWEAWAQIVQGWALARSGRHAEGIAVLTEGIEKYAGTGSRLILPYATALLADARCAAGHVAECMRIARELDDARATNEVKCFDDMSSRITARLRSVTGEAGA